MIFLELGMLFRLMNILFIFSNSKLDQNFSCQIYILFDIKITTVEEWITACTGFGICRDTNLHTYMDNEGERQDYIFAIE